MNAFFIMMALVSHQADYQVFTTSHLSSGEAQDRWGSGEWGESSFVVHNDADPYLYNETQDKQIIEFVYPLNTGDDDDLWFEKGVTYSVRLAEGSWSPYTINQWFPIDAITVPTEVSEAWADSISIQYFPVTVSWRLIDDETLRFQFKNLSTYTHIFMVFPIPGSQDLSPTTWGSVKSSF